MAKINLWVLGQGWREFDSTDAEALKERGITIGYGASIDMISKLPKTCTYLAKEPTDVSN